MFATTTDTLRVMRDKLADEIESRERQISALEAALGALVSEGADDAVINLVVDAIELIDTGMSAVGDVDEQTEPVAELADEPEPTETPSEAPEADEYEPTERERIIANLRSMGYRGAGVDALIRKYHQDMVEDLWQRAEADLNGQLVRPEHRATYTSVRRFWSCNERELNKYASDELLEWFDQNGRMTYRMLRDMMLTGKHYAGSGYLNNR